MVERVVWQYWEDSSEYPYGIPYIEMCQRSVDIHSASGIGYKIIRLNNNNIKDYLDDINPLIFKAKSDSRLEQKTNYLKVKILCKYGGIWLDSDSVVVGPLDSIFDILDNIDFYGYCINPTVWAFACKPRTTIIKKWCDHNEKKLVESRGFGLGIGDLGYQNLRKIINECKDNTLYRFDYDNFLFHKIEHNQEDISKYIKPNQSLLMVNSLFASDFKTMSKPQIIKHSNLIADLFSMSGVTRNIVIITSVIKTNSSPLSSFNCSILNDQQRYHQTINTISSIRKKLPDTEILLVEWSDICNDWEENLSGSVDHYLNLYRDEKNRVLVQSQCNESVDGVMTLAAFKYLERIYYNSLIKISGRCILTEEFNSAVFENDTSVFRVVPDMENVNTAIYKLIREDVPKFVLFLEQYLDHMIGQAETYENIVNYFRQTINHTCIEYIGVESVCEMRNKLTRF